MLELIDFKKEFVSQCRGFLDDFGDGDIQIEERIVSKAQRGMLNGLLFTKEGVGCAPTLYVEDFFKDYQNGVSIEDLSKSAAKIAVGSMDIAGCITSKAKSVLSDMANLRVRLLSKDRNEDYLKGIPFKDASDGFVLITDIESGEYRAVITNELLGSMEMTADELFEKALENTMRNYPPVLYDLSETVMNGAEDCENILDDPVSRIPAKPGLGYVLTNSRFFWGAGVLFYPGMMEKIHELMDGDFYVLPSSVHEFILLAYADQNQQQLADLIRSANHSIVEDEDILSDDLYVCESGRLRRLSYEGALLAK